MRFTLACAAVGLVLFLTCVTWRVKGGRRVKLCVDKDNCTSQATKEGHKSTLLVATLRSQFVTQLSAETLSPATATEVQQSFEWSCPRAIM